MTKIELSFAPEMEYAIIDGKKICTTRHAKHGRRGDTFEVKGLEYTILGVVKMTLKKAIEEYWELEGFSSPDEMFNFWIKAYDIQNTYQFTREYHRQTVFVHFVSRVFKV